MKWHRSDLQSRQIGDGRSVVDVDAHYRAPFIEVYDYAGGNFPRIGTRSFGQIDIERIGVRIVVEYHRVTPGSRGPERHSVVLIPFASAR